MGSSVKPRSTMLDLLRDRTENIRERGSRLIREFSGMHPVNEPGESCKVFNPHGDQFWDPLSPKGKQFQSQILPEWNRLAELIRVVSALLPDSARRDLGDACDSVQSPLFQERKTWCKTPEKAVEDFEQAIDEVLRILSDYFSGESNPPLAIPDTNALLANPAMEDWCFEGVPCFEFVLTPTVLGELDEHKVNHRNSEVRGKAEQIIRRIKEYRRRGALHDGVTLVKGAVSLRAIAMEPDMKQTLSWLDPSNNDDRFLATSLQIIRENMGRSVFIVTRDINMQNKAELAGIPSCEVPTGGPHADLFQ